MYLRYWVTYRHLRIGEVKNETALLGKFRDQEAANAASKVRYPYAEIIEVRAENKFDAIRYEVARFVIRSLRVAGGVAIAIVSYVFVLDPMPDVTDIPLASLTLGMIIGALFRLALGMSMMIVAWWSAFGDGPKENI